MGQRVRPAARVAVALLTSIVLAGCGGGSPGTAKGGSARPATLILDFTPNAIHAGIYTAIARGYDRARGVALHVVIPGTTTDAVKLLTGGRVDFAILDIHDLAIARQQGEPLVGVMTIVERPLAAVIAAPGVSSPRALAGRTVGVTGAPSDLAVLRSEVGGAGGNPARVRPLTIGFNAVPDLLGGRVAAATAFWNDEGVTLARTHRGFHIFRVEDYGAPPYPELVLCTTRAELRSHPRLVRGVVGALRAGYTAVLRNPGAAEHALEAQVSGLSAPLVHAQLQAELPAFRPLDGGAVGELVPRVLRSWARWEARFGIVRRPPDVAQMFVSEG